MTSPCLESRSTALQWRHNWHDSVSNHQPHDCLLNRLFRRRSKITSKLRVTGLCARNSPVTGEFPVQMASNGKNVAIWWRHHGVAAILFWPPHVCDGIVQWLLLVCIVRIENKRGVALMLFNLAIYKQAQHVNESSRSCVIRSWPQIW